MNPHDLINAAPAIAKGAAEIIAAVPIADIVKRICGPPADLLGEKLKERVERCFQKTAQMTEEAGVTPQAVPPKLLFPILQGASLEDDENLHTMWAALLANAASPENAGKVRPGFIDALRGMSPDEAVLLNFIYARHVSDGFSSVDPSGTSDDNLGVSLDGLEALQLIRRSDASLYQYRPSYPDPTEMYGTLPKSRAAVYAERTDKTYLLTDRGRAFVEACRPPKPQG